MRDLFLNNGLRLNSLQEEKFKIFSSLLEEYNKKFNLTSIKSGIETEVKHFLDCAKGVDSFPQNASVIEIGSGGGFPSVPLMIMREDLKFTLVESTSKKCEFLKIVCDNLGFNCSILNERAEDLGRKKEYREQFDISTARAVARLNVLCEYCLPFVKVGGKFVAYKARAEEELNEATNAISVLGGKIKDVCSYELNVSDGQRTIINIEKIKPTPEKYPRGNGKERKSPL